MVRTAALALAALIGVLACAPRVPHADAQLLAAFNGARSGDAYSIGLAWSDDGNTWQRLGQPVLTPSQPWEGDVVKDPWLMPGRRDGLRMVYSGYDGTRYRLGAATSPDGLRWDRTGPLGIAESGTWRDSVTFPVVVRDGGRWRMWFTGWDGDHYRIGTAVSDHPEGPWDVHPDPVLDVGEPGTFDDEGVLTGAVVRDDGEWVLLYGGMPVSNGYSRSWSAGVATSSDGVTWTRQGRVLEPGRWTHDVSGSAGLGGPHVDGSVVPRSALRTDDGWRVFGTAFQTTPGELAEVAVEFVVDELQAPWRPGDGMWQVNGWASRSAENPSVVRYSIPR